MGEWISVKDRLPVECEDVLVRCKNGAMFVGYFRLDYNKETQWMIHTVLSSARKLNKGRVTHWIPLPKQPKEG